LRLKRESSERHYNTRERSSSRKKGTSGLKSTRRSERKYRQLRSYAKTCCTRLRKLKPIYLLSMTNSYRLPLG
jgi:hypothetical protein